MERNGKVPRRKPTNWQSTTEGTERYKEPPAKSQEGRDAQMIDLAYGLVEQRLRDGTASSQETVHFLRLATEKTRLEEQKLRYEASLLETKEKAIKDAERSDTDYAMVITYLKKYQGIPDD
jgi:hypothetical protein